METRSDPLAELGTQRAPELLAALRRCGSDAAQIISTLETQLSWIQAGSRVEMTLLVPESRSTDDGSVIILLERPGLVWAIPYAPEGHEEVLADAVINSSLFPWAKAPQLSRMLTRIADILLPRLESKGISFRVVDYNNLFVISADRVLHDFPRFRVPDDMELRSLRLEDDTTLNASWPSGTPATLSLQHDVITHGGGLGLYRKGDGRLVAWVVRAQWGSLGQLWVNPELRGRQLARILVSEMARKVAELGAHPYCNISVENTASRRVFQSLGFEQDECNLYVQC